MELVSSWCYDGSLPESYVMPVETRPGKLINAPLGKSIPVIDLQRHDRSHTIQQILKAGEEYGFFQVTNHGVSEELMDETMKVAEEFHAMPGLDKERESSKDPKGSCKLYTSSYAYPREDFHYWRDALTHPCRPLEERIQFWPEKPTRYRQVVGAYSVELWKLSCKILELICEGLGLNTGYFSNDLTQVPNIMINHYPPCPEPSLTLGLSKHRDPSIITILLQGRIQGLQVFNDGQWIGVQPLPHGFVVNIGYLLQKLVSSWCNDETLPESYIFPPETRPGEHIIPRCNTIPVIDLSKAMGHDRTHIVQQILKASQEFGFFQVVNHGVSENLINDTMSVFKEFFEMPAEDKASVYSEDPGKPCRLYTSSTNYDHEKVHLWRDNLRHPCHPLEQWIKLWPEKPTRYREVVATYSIEANKLGLRILELVSEGLGFESGYFGGKLSESLLLSANHYPTCPDPSLTLGVPNHCDPNLITILLQGDVNGLQVFKDGEWVGVEPLHNAFVVNIGHQLQIISNNKLKSAEHRAVTNSTAARTSVAFFISPSDDCIIEPVADAYNSPVYRSFRYKEFLINYIPLMGNSALSLEPFKLSAS